MKVTIIGWYGTETIGDRAILAGIVLFLSKAYGCIDISLGSLYPFFSERTLNEDYDFYKEITNQEISISLFNSKNSRELNAEIKNSDLVLMGGGPMMDLQELYMVEYAFKKARKHRVKTLLMGCGLGPLYKKSYRKSVLNIVRASDQIILRDKESYKILTELFTEFSHKERVPLVQISFDPAVVATQAFKSMYESKSADYIAINLREFPIEYTDNTEKYFEINKNLHEYVNHLAAEYKDREISLVPMHYFHVGGDDRSFANKIAQQLECPNVSVQNRPLSLRETLKLYNNAYINIGMRFHSVVLQTVLNTDNYILDYTQPNIGKISGFINSIDAENFYQKRYVALQSEQVNLCIHKDIRQKFICDETLLEGQHKVYIESLLSLMDE